jgi:hypothetical protein
MKIEISNRQPTARIDAKALKELARRLSAYPPPAMVPSSFTTRCQGRSSGQQRMAQPTCRAARGLPSMRATCP